MSNYFHLALSADWAQAFSTGEYLTSTGGRTIKDEGFMHMSHARQVRGVADAFYRDRADVVLLVIDAARLTDPVREDAVPGTDELYPHLYGPLPVIAVSAAYPLGLNADGTLDLDPYIAPTLDA